MSHKALKFHRTQNQQNVKPCLGVVEEEMLDAEGWLLDAGCWMMVRQRSSHRSGRVWHLSAKS